MDNILKLLLGVLGVSGMIAMVTSNLSFEPQVQVQSQTPMPPPPEIIQSNEDEVEEPVPDEDPAEASEEDGDDIFAVGEPMIDGNPYGTNNPQQQPSNPPPMVPEFAPSGNSNFSQSAPQSYDPQQYYTPQSAPGNYAIAEGQ
jgi:hypothetical protein